MKIMLIERLFFLHFFFKIENIDVYLTSFHLPKSSIHSIIFNRSKVK